MTKEAKLPKTAQGAIKNARAELGKDAEQGVHFEIKNTGAGYDFQKLSKTPLADRAAAAKVNVAAKRAARAAAVSPPPAPKAMAIPASAVLLVGPKKAAKPKKPRAPLPPVLRASELPDAPRGPVTVAAAVPPKQKKAAKALGEAMQRATIATVKPTRANKAAAKKSVAKAKKEITTTAPKAKPKKVSTLSLVIEMMLRPQGATVAQVQKRFGWADHTCRARMSGTAQEKGYTVTTSKDAPGDPPGVRVYRTTPLRPQAPPAPQESVGDAI